MSVPAGSELPHSGLVSVDELRNYMSGSVFTTSQQQVAAMLLMGVQQELENYLSRPLEPVQVREVLRADQRGYLNPSVTPIHKVILLEAVDTLETGFDPLYDGYVPPVAARDPLIGENGRLLDHLYPVVNDPIIHGNGIYIGEMVQRGGFDGGFNADYAVDYVGGYNGYVDSALKMDILRVAAREMAPNHDKTVSLRGDQAQAASEGDTRPRGWTLEELQGWDRLRRRVVA